MGDVIDLFDTTDLVDVIAIKVGYEWRDRQIKFRERFQVPRALAEILHARFVIAYPEEIQGV